MKKILLFSICSLIFINCGEQRKIVNREYINPSGEASLTGEITTDIFYQNDSFKWFSEGFNEYTPEKTITDDLRKYISPYKIHIYMGTWDKNSQEEVPKLFKTLNQVKYPTGRIKIYGLTENIESFRGEQRKYHVDTIPTIIIFRKNKEKGRIRIYPSISWEEHLLKIVEQRTTKNVMKKQATQKRTIEKQSTKKQSKKELYAEKRALKRQAIKERYAKKRAEQKERKANRQSK